MINVNDIIKFIQLCEKTEFNSIREAVRSRQEKNRQEAKAQFEIGNIVTCDHPRWPHHLGNATVIKINNKNIKVRFNNGSIMIVSPGLLKPIKIENNENVGN